MQANQSLFINQLEVMLFILTYWKSWLSFLCLHDEFIKNSFKIYTVFYPIFCTLICHHILMIFSVSFMNLNDS